jgi:hypothetical protein
MTCPTCGHTMQSLEIVPGMPLFWCPRCGSLHEPASRGFGAKTQTPQLVERCREYEDTQIGGVEGTFWEGMGIAEAIAKPEDRR